jgi:hypothetical protein
MKLPNAYKYRIGICFVFYLFSNTHAQPTSTCPYALDRTPKEWTVRTMEELNQVMDSNKFDNRKENLLGGAEYSVQGRSVDDELYSVQRIMYTTALSGTRISQITQYRNRWDWAIREKSKAEIHNQIKWRMLFFSKSLVQGSFKDVHLGSSNDITHRPIMKALLEYLPVWLDAARYGETNGPSTPRMSVNEYGYYLEEMETHRRKKEATLEHSGLSKLIKEHWNLGKKHAMGEESLIELWARNPNIADLVNPESDMELIVSSLMTVYHFTIKMSDKAWPVIWEQLYQNHVNLPDALVQEVWDLGDDPSWKDINQAKHIQEAYVKLTSAVRITDFTVREALQDVELEGQSIRKGDLINLDIPAFQDRHMNELVGLSVSERLRADRMLSQLMFGSVQPRTNHRACPGRAVCGEVLANT